MILVIDTIHYTEMMATEPTAEVVPPPSPPTPPTPPRLDTLPAELLLEIFAHLAPVPSRRPVTPCEFEKSDLYRVNISLRNVKAVCRTFATLVTPLITAHYSDVDFYHLRLNAQRPENWTQVKTVILDRALHDERRHLGHRQGFHQFLKLRDLDAQLGLSEAWSDDGEASDSDDEDSERIYVNPLDQEEWKQRMDKDHGTEHTSQSNYERAAVLCLCPNVEEVLYGGGDMYRWDVPTAITPIVRAAQNEKFGEAHRFEKLRYLSIDVEWIRTANVVPVMQLPSLRHLVLECRFWVLGGYHQRETNHEALSTWGCPERSSNVETLEMRDIACPSFVVVKLLRSCKTLRKFMVDCSVASRDNRKWYVGIVEELKEHADTLRELVVTSRTISDYGDGPPVIAASQLQAFGKLERLKIPLRLSTGYGGATNDASCPPLPDMGTMFPSSLQSLEIDIHGPTPYEETTNAFAQLLCQSHGALKRIHVVSHTYHRTIHNEDYETSTTAHPTPMDLPLLYTLSLNNPSTTFDYTLLHHEADSPQAIEWARTRILWLPNGEELLKHATCGLEKRWNQLLSRPVGTVSPFHVVRNMKYERLQVNGCLDDGLSAEKLAEELKPFETPARGRRLPYRFRTVQKDGRGPT